MAPNGSAGDKCILRSNRCDKRFGETYKVVSTNNGKIADVHLAHCSHLLLVAV